jgi:hypothetical protein
MRERSKVGDEAAGEAFEGEDGDKEEGGDEDRVNSGAANPKDREQGRVMQNSPRTAGPLHRRNQIAKASAECPRVVAAK